jgi:hypothetical protein
MSFTLKSTFLGSYEKFFSRSLPLCTEKRVELPLIASFGGYCKHKICEHALPCVYNPLHHSLPKSNKRLVSRKRFLRGADPTRSQLEYWV